ncbi:2-dehydropantoate 2-reductase N-terminal domain-containing protein [Streptomyces sp. JV176]|uniref:ketopantoate reductase family protein n=1 Tax=Streptomyces sp. JV176 TaxID=858630 RepID=UPI002E774889|nr:2-dehydropantoate 2-reductase N-terminal domain-containing protein [Streptomyces sp. JV176]MEE1800703.1 2-dehydropantoate 2-reductase N-terminal domain-containing protein [Streptomyces sp. JV176]
MKRPSVLIVGAGATGLSVGYHLALGGADITFLVRPGRASALQSRPPLYCYDDAALKPFDGYKVVEGTDELAGESFRFVLVTLDGHASRTDESVAMLRGLGDAIRGTDAHVIMCAFGMGVRQHYLDALGVPDDRLSHGFVGTLVHQTAADLPVNAPTDPARLARASVAYKHPANKGGFRLESGNAEAAKRFAELYNRSGVSRCLLMSRGLDEIFSDSGSPVYMAGAIAGWPDFTTLVADKELWRLACRAQGEIMALPKNGLRGKLMARLLGPRATAKVHLTMEREMLPLDYQAFNRFHHGGKVHAQDVEGLRTCLTEGRRHGRPMTALATLLERLDAREAADHRSATAHG